MNKQVEESLRDTARALPRMVDTKKPEIRRMVSGQSLWDAGVKEVGKEGEKVPVDPKKNYLGPPEHPEIDHFAELKKAFKKFGWKGVELYQDVVMRAFNKNFETEKTTEKPKKDAPKRKSRKKSV